MFKVNNLTAYINDKKLFDNFNMTIEDGEIHALMGINGIGKSSLCKIIMGDKTYTIKNGQILYNGVSLLDKSTSEIAQTGVMYISQNPASIEGVTNAEMLRMALNAKTKENINIFEFNKKLEEACDKLSLDRSFIHKEINVGASGGERKKVEMLHIAILKPSFIILDELDSGLDVDALKVVCNFINEYQKENKCSILIITHHKNILDYIKPNYVHIISDGKIVKTGDHHLAESIENEGFAKANDIDKDNSNE